MYSIIFPNRNPRNVNIEFFPIQTWNVFKSWLKLAWKNLHREINGAKKWIVATHNIRWWLIPSSKEWKKKKSLWVDKNLLYESIIRQKPWQCFSFPIRFWVKTALFRLSVTNFRIFIPVFREILNIWSLKKKSWINNITWVFVLFKNEEKKSHYTE